jgi:hypothetical protein
MRRQQPGKESFFHRWLKDATPSSHDIRFQLPFKSFSKVRQNVLLMEEILHQLINGLSRYNPIIYSVS